MMLDYSDHICELTRGGCPSQFADNIYSQSNHVQPPPLYSVTDAFFCLFSSTDLSRNRFCELPEDITSLAFLERLLVFHNTIRSIPDTIRGLHSLTYLDLRLVSHERPDSAPDVCAITISAIHCNSISAFLINY